LKSINPRIPGSFSSMLIWAISVFFRKLISMNGQTLSHGLIILWVCRGQTCESVHISIEHAKGCGNQDRIMDAAVLGPFFPGPLDVWGRSGLPAPLYLCRDMEQGLHFWGQGGIVKILEGPIYDSPVALIEFAGRCRMT